MHSMVQIDAHQHAALDVVLLLFLNYESQIPCGVCAMADRLQALPRAALEAFGLLLLPIYLLAVHQNRSGVEGA